MVKQDKIFLQAQKFLYNLVPINLFTFKLSGHESQADKLCVSIT